jgi:gentisate 1,2-dioxygenase
MIDEAMPQGERLVALNQRMNQHSLAGYWQPRQQRPQLVPCLWPWPVVNSCLMEAGEVVSLGSGNGDAFRRVVQLVNPGTAAQKSTSRTLQVSFQLVHPGETAECHRHTAAALRFIIEGDGTAFTNVEGEQMLMEPGDLVLTPNWTWHSHENPGKKPVIWLDVLDTQLTSYLDAAFREDYVSAAEAHANYGRVASQPVIKPDGYCRQVLGNVRSRVACDPSRVLPYTYKWCEALQALTAMHASGERDPYDGTLLDYANPLTGGPTMPTIACSIQMLAPGESTKAHSHTSSTVYFVVRGEGVSSVGTKGRAAENLEWQARDCFFVPSKAWHQHTNRSDREAAILFSVTDRPVLESLGLYREELG